MTVTIHIGDCREILATLPDCSVQCVVTSPPYFGLRDYGVGGQIGLEASPAEFVTTMVEVFREVRRVLADDGTLWLNLGDSYCSIGGVHQGRDDNQAGVGSRVWREGAARADGKVRADGQSRRNRNGTAALGLKPKDLMMMPARVAIALKEDGWWLRSDIIWAKPNPMPESVSDRPTAAHEHVFLLSKSARYYYDAAAIREPIAESQIGRVRADPVGGASHRERGQCSAGGVHKTDKQRGHSRCHDGFNDRWDAMEKGEQQANGANCRNVWNIATQPFSEAHFATFPPALAERCIKAGTKPGDTVLDPFGGAGTTGLVADRLQRNAILIELNPAYAAMAEKRIATDRGALLDYLVAAE